MTCRLSVTGMLHVVWKRSAVVQCLNETTCRSIQKQTTCRLEWRSSARESGRSRAGWLTYSERHVVSRCWAVSFSALNDRSSVALFLKTQQPHLSSSSFFFFFTFLSLSTLSLTRISPSLISPSSTTVGGLAGGEWQFLSSLLFHVFHAFLLVMAGRNF